MDTYFLVKKSYSVSSCLTQMFIVVVLMMIFTQFFTVNHIKRTVFLNYLCLCLELILTVSRYRKYKVYIMYIIIIIFFLYCSFSKLLPLKNVHAYNLFKYFRILIICSWAFQEIPSWL